MQPKKNQLPWFYICKYFAIYNIRTYINFVLLTVKICIQYVYLYIVFYGSKIPIQIYLFEHFIQVLQYIGRLLHHNLIINSDSNLSATVYDPVYRGLRDAGKATP